MTVITRAELDQQMRAIDLWRDHYTMHQIAHDMHVTPKTVDMWLTSWGIVRRCESCGCILEAEETGQCATCRRRTNGERHVYCRTPMPSVEPEPVNLGEVFRYA